MIYVAVDKVGIAVLDNVPQGTEDREQWSVCQGSNVARMFLTQERMPRIGWESPQKKRGYFTASGPHPQTPGIHTRGLGTKGWKPRGSPSLSRK